MSQPVGDDVLSEFGAPGGSLDDFLAEEYGSAEEQSGSEEVYESEESPAKDIDLPTAMFFAAEAAVFELSKYPLTPKADAFLSFLVDFKNEIDHPYE